MLSEIEKDAKQRMDKTLATLDDGFSKIRAGRASPNLLAAIEVDYYGQLTPISQVASISVEDARTLKVVAWEKNMTGAIEKAIMTSDLGLNPVVAGEVMRIPLPPLTEERRQDLVKVVKEEAENAKIAIRNIRRDANSDFKDLLKESVISKDQEHDAEVDMQKTTDEHIHLIDQKLDEKKTSLMEI